MIAKSSRVKDFYKKGWQERLAFVKAFANLSDQEVDLLSQIRMVDGYAYDPTIENSTYKDNEIYNSLSIKDFIHRCYVESSEYFLDNCDLFVKKSDRKDKIYEIIKNCTCITTKVSACAN